MYMATIDTKYGSSYSEPNYSAEFKFQTVMDLLRGEKSVEEICDERGITQAQVYRWRLEFVTKAPTVFSAE